jgi:UDP:flavonoid glycosyltransferase YjiC (YdhE family)
MAYGNSAIKLIASMTQSCTQEPSAGRPKKKILFFAEGATLAHVGRPYVLAESLNPCEYDISFARPKNFAWLTAKTDFRVLDLYCQDSETFAKKLDWGQPLYDLATLERYVNDDLKLIETEQPDVIIGDFRLSLSISARLAKIPYFTICDAYWSPERPLALHLPVFKWTPFVPLSIAEWMFSRIAPATLRFHTAPLEKLRARYGLSPLGHDLRLCYTDADIRLLANIPQLYTELVVSNNATFLGPVAWSPKGAIPDVIEDERDFIYVTMGSSGDPKTLDSLIPVLEETGLPLVISSAGKPTTPSRRNSKTHIFEYLPGELVCKRAALVVCNGGSPTTNQALVNGVPVLGIPRNMDQFLNMETIQKFGAGLSLRADRLSAETIHKAGQALLFNSEFRNSAERLRGPPALQAFHSILNNI